MKNKGRHEITASNVYFDMQAIPIIVGWKMGASKMGYITKEEWIKTLEAAR